MKIAGYQLENTLARGLKPIYLIAGDDAFLCYEALSSLQLAGKKHGFSERIKWSIQQENSDDLLSTLLFSNSLFQDKEFIELDFGDKFPSNTQQQLLQNAFQAPHQQKLMVMQCKKLDDKVQKTGWFQALDKIGLVISIWPLNYDQLKIFITTYAKKHHMTIDMDAVTLLANFTEGNVSIATQTLEKIRLLDEKHITVLLINNLIEYDNHYTVFDLGDALVMCDLARMLKILKNLQEENVEPVLILWSLTREIRILIDCLMQQTKNNDLQTIFKKHRVLTKKQEIIQRHLKQHSLAICYLWLQHAFLIDQKIKRFLIADAWRELQLFCLRALQ